MTRKQINKLVRSVEDSCGDARLLLAAPIPDWSEIADLLSDAGRDLERVAAAVDERWQMQVAEEDLDKGTP